VDDGDEFRVEEKSRALRAGCFLVGSVDFPFLVDRRKAVVWLVLRGLVCGRHGICGDCIHRVDVVAEEAGEEDGVSEGLCARDGVDPERRLGGGIQACLDASGFGLYRGFR